MKASSANLLSLQKGYGSDGVFNFFFNEGFDEECSLFLECSVDVYNEDGEIEEVVNEILDVN